MHGLKAAAGRRARLLLPRALPLRLVRGGPRALRGAARAAPCAARPAGRDAPLGPGRQPPRRPLRRELAAHPGADRALLRARVRGRPPTGRHGPLPAGRARRAPPDRLRARAPQAPARRARGGAPRTGADPRGGLGPGPRRLAAAFPEAEFLGRVGDGELERLYATARAVLVPSMEEFGITAVEAQASGRPVIAAAAGGALETVLDGATGRLVPLDDVEAFRAAIAELDRLGFDPAEAVRNAERFSVEAFRRGLDAQVAAALAAGPEAGGERRPIPLHPPLVGCAADGGRAPSHSVAGRRPEREGIRRRAGCGAGAGHGLAAQGHRIDCFLPSAVRELPPHLRDLPNVSFIQGTSEWRYDRWYSRGSIAIFLSGLLSRGLGLAAPAPRGPAPAPPGPLRRPVPVLEHRVARGPRSPARARTARDPPRDAHRRRAALPVARAPARAALPAEAELRGGGRSDGAARRRSALPGAPRGPADLHQQRLPRPHPPRLRLPARAHGRRAQPDPLRALHRAAARARPRRPADGARARPHLGAEGNRRRDRGRARAALARLARPGARRRRPDAVVGLPPPARGAAGARTPSSWGASRRPRSRPPWSAAI